MTTNENEMSLDEQCARAMGWRKIRDCSMHKPRPPRYSTDPALLDAKLEWLDQNRVGHIRIDRSGISRRCRLACVVGDENSRAIDNLFVDGPTIHKATARLVVAVAERLKEAKKP